MVVGSSQRGMEAYFADDLLLLLFIHHHQVWEKEHEAMLSCADPTSASKMLITSRIR